MLFSSSYKYTMQVSPSGMAAASQAVPGEFDSRHLLQKEKHTQSGVFLLFLGKSVKNRTKIFFLTLQSVEINAIMIKQSYESIDILQISITTIFS